MSALERSGMLALCMVILLSAVFRAPRNAMGVGVPAAEAPTSATDLTAPRAEVTAPEPEPIVSVGRFRWSPPEDARALATRLQSLAEALCFSASALRLVDDAACRQRLTGPLQDTCRDVTAFLSLLESRR
ncbi:MAG: hypothetical protein ACREUT_14250 [Steroidobacteraceae bacterium]